MADMFEYFDVDVDWDFGPDPATGEPIAYEVKVYTLISREDALKAIRDGFKKWIAVKAAGRKERFGDYGCKIFELPF